MLCEKHQIALVHLTVNGYWRIQETVTYWAYKLAHSSCTLQIKHGYIQFIFIFADRISQTRITYTQNLLSFYIFSRDHFERLSPLMAQSHVSVQSYLYVLTFHLTTSSLRIRKVTLISGQYMLDNESP